MVRRRRKKKAQQLRINLSIPRSASAARTPRRWSLGGFRPPVDRGSSVLYAPRFYPEDHSSVDRSSVGESSVMEPSTIESSASETDFAESSVMGSSAAASSATGSSSSRSQSSRRSRASSVPRRYPSAHLLPKWRQRLNRY